MFKSLNPINNILLAANNRTIARDKNLLNDANNYVCFINNSENSIGFNVTLEGKHDIPHKFLVYLKDSNGLVLCSGSKLSGNQVTLTGDAKIESVYAHPADDLVLELSSPNGDVVFSQPVKLKIYYLPVTNESDVLYRKGFPVEVLDGINKIFNASNTNTVTPGTNTQATLYTVAQLVASAHLYIPPNYDVWNGAPYFGNYSNKNAITFHLNAYMYVHTYPVLFPYVMLNCYDCAAFLQIILRQNNYSTYYSYMSPFGYINQTSLIGRGQCNNPFYRGVDADRIIARMSPNRTGFGNHAFLRLISNNDILDSCSGPHIGGEDINAYITSAIDTQHYVPPRSNTGTAANVGYYTGVTNYDLINPVTENNYSDKATEELFNMNNLNANNLGSQKVQPNLQAFETSMNSSGWETGYKETVPGLQEAVQLFFFEKEGHIIYLKAYVAKETNEYSVNRLLDLAFNIQAEEHGLNKVKESPYQQHLESISDGKQVSLIQHYNMVLHAYTTDNNVHLTDLTKAFADSINQSLTTSDQVKDVNVNLSYNRTSGQYRLDLLESDNDDVLEFIDLNNNIKIIDSSDSHLVFEKIAKKKTSIQVWSVNKSNLRITENKVLPIK